MTALLGQKLGRNGDVDDSCCRALIVDARKTYLLLHTEEVTGSNPVLPIPPSPVLR